MSVTCNRSRVFRCGLALAGAAVIALVLVHQTYARTKKAWYAVGLNDGRIAQEADVLQRLRASGLVHPCPLGARVQARAVVSVKAEAVFVASDGSTQYLCE